MVTYSDIHNVLFDSKYISEVSIKPNTGFNGEMYTWLIYCKLDILKEWIPIAIGVPTDWKLNLFDFYLVDTLPFIPHLDKKGKLCLFDLEGTIVYPNFEGVFNQCIRRAIEIIGEGILESNKKDFIKEFDSYFALLEGTLKATVAFPTEKYSSSIYFCEKTDNIKKRKNESLVDCLKRVEKTTYFASSNQNHFSVWGYKLEQRKGVYLRIKPSEYIYPPNIYDYKLDEFLNVLLTYVNVTLFKQLNRKITNKLFLVFEIQQDDELVSSCGFIIENPKFLLQDKVELVSCSKIIPLSIQRVDVDYLSTRTSFSVNTIADKSILLIGCGSIGGYVFHDLIKSGCKSCTLVDDDIFKPENIYRHFLGVESTNKYKTDALLNYANSTLPEMNVKVFSKKIEDAINNDDLNFNDFDYIVSATGNHTINGWLNNYLLKNKIYRTAFFIWNEPLDIGCHVARINIKGEGNYRNIIIEDDNEILDLASFVENGQNFSKSYSGCSGTFIPYGSTLSVESSLLFMDLLKRDIQGRLKNNVLVSKKGDDYYIKEAGFSVSRRYEKQQEIYSETALFDLRKDEFF